MGLKELGLRSGGYRAILGAGRNTPGILLLTALLGLTYLPGCNPFFNADPVIKKPVWKPEFEHSLFYAQGQLKKTLAQVTDINKFPNSVEDGRTWKTSKSDGWTSGFFPGSLWLMYEATGDEFWRQNGEKWLAGLEKEQNNDTNHDIGFMMYCTYGAALRLTGNPACKPVLLQSARALAARYRPVVGCTRSWGNKNDDGNFLVIIDNMMNLELLYWASKNGGGAELAAMANSHARKTAANHIRADGSTYHVLVYNPITGVVQGDFNSQGYTKESCWSRGLAWAVYGFTLSFRETANQEFLTTARKCADYFIKNSPADGVPYWDFGVARASSPRDQSACRTCSEPQKSEIAGKMPAPRAKRDASAAAICASGLIELSSLDPENRDKYLAAAERILTTLSKPPYLTEGTENPAVIQNVVASWRDSLDDKERSFIYGDYYFIEALVRYKKIADFGFRIERIQELGGAL